MSHSTTVKIAVIGDSNVGKTSIIRRFVAKEFVTEYKATVGADFASKNFVVNDEQVTLQIWDTAGQERFQSMSTSYFRGCEAVLVVFDITNDDTFGKIDFWISEFLRGAGLDTAAGFPLFVVGNKIDAIFQNSPPPDVTVSELRKSGVGARKVGRKRAFEVCKGKGFAYVECSAKTGENIDNLFRSCAAAAIDRRSGAPAPAALPAVQLEKRQKSRSHELDKSTDKSCSC